MRKAKRRKEPRKARKARRPRLPPRREERKVNETKVVLGLGNPGSEYEGTRHNAGFMAVDVLSQKLGRFSGWRRDGVLLRGEGRAGRHTVAVVKPQTYMNRSGEAFRELVRQGWIAPEILVALDDVYLPLGTIRLRGSGGTARHHGLESIRPSTGTDGYPRLRIGVGPAPPSPHPPEHVLGRFGPAERPRLAQAPEG